MPIERIPADVKQRYATAFEIDSSWLIKAGSRRQKWIDQAQSLNLYMSEPNGKKLDEMYKLAWTSGLKTTYYLRTTSATQAEKSTVKNGALNAVAATTVTAVADIVQPGKACLITDPDCESCQ